MSARSDAARQRSRLQAARRGDRNALIALIEHCSDAIARGLAAAGYTRAFVDYEDARQDALTAILSSLAEAPDIGSPCGWMHNVARNRSIGRVRSKEAYRRGTERLIQRTPPSSFLHNDDPSDGTPDAAELAQLVLGALPPEYREVVVAYYLDETSVADIAADLYIAEETVYTRLRRARKAMLQALREHGHA